MSEPTLFPARRPYTWQLFAQLADIPLQFVHHYTQRVPLTAPQTVRYGPHRRQYFLAWAPPAGVAPRPLALLFWHGGGWRTGWPGMFPAVPAFFLNLGLPVIMPAYRLAPAYSHVDMREDLDLALTAALDWLEMRVGRDYRLVFAGMSAGATLAAHLAFDRAGLARLGVPAERRAGFLGCAGPLDLNCMPGFGPLYRYAGGKRGSAAFRAANPIYGVAAQEDLPALLLHARTDGIVPWTCSESFRRQYPAATAIELFNLPGRTHLDSLRFATDDGVTAARVRQWLLSL
jgi:dienelactone hydrolase